MRPVNALSLATALLCFACGADKLTGTSTATAKPISPTPIPFRPVFTVSPDPPNGTESLQVTFDMCASTGISLKYEVESDFTRGVGLKGQGPCRVIYTYRTESRRTAAGSVSVQMDCSYRMTVTDVGRTPPVSASQEGTAHVFPRATR